MTTKAVCHICGHPAIARPDQLCGQCRRVISKLPDHYGRDDIELVGGEWVNDGGVMRWQPNEETA